MLAEVYDCCVIHLLVSNGVTPVAVLEILPRNSFKFCSYKQRADKDQTVEVCDISQMVNRNSVEMRSHLLYLDT